MMADDPRVLLQDFLDKLPASIKDGLTSSIAIFYSGSHGQNITMEQSKLIIKNALQDEEDIFSVPRKLSFLCASIDHVLTRSSVAGENILKRAAEKTDNKQLRAAVLSEPLREKHSQHVRAEWAKLRSSRLSAQKIVDFEYILLRKLLLSLK